MIKVLFVCLSIMQQLAPETLKILTLFYWHYIIWQENVLGKGFSVCPTKPASYRIAFFLMFWAQTQSVSKSRLNSFFIYSGMAEYCFS